MNQYLMHMNGSNTSRIPRNRPKRGQCPRDERRHQVARAEGDELAVGRDHVPKPGCVLFGGDDGIEEADDGDEAEE